jgi:hypothetical protein
MTLLFTRHYITHWAQYSTHHTTQHISLHHTWHFATHCITPHITFLQAMVALLGMLPFWFKVCCEAVFQRHAQPTDPASRCPRCRCVVELFFSDTRSLTIQLPAALSWSSPARAPCMLYSTLRAYSDVSVSRFSVSHLPSTYIQFVSCHLSSYLLCTARSFVLMLSDIRIYIANQWIRISIVIWRTSAGHRHLC